MAGLEIIRPKPPEPVGLVSDRRLCQTGDLSEIVEEGDARSAFLFATPGRVIPHDVCAKYGLTQVDGKIVLASGYGASAVPVSQGDVAATPGGPEPSDVPAVEKPAKRTRGK